MNNGIKDIKSKKRDFTTKFVKKNVMKSRFFYKLMQKRSKYDKITNERNKIA